jgi:hypothetical protein
LLVNVLLNGYVPVAAVAVNFRVSELPGGIPAPVPTLNWETDQVAPEDVKAAQFPPVVALKKPPGVQAVMDQPVGALIVNAVTVYWLLAGFATVSVNC